MNTPEWQKFRVGAPSSTDNWTNPDCCPFSTVSHVTHIESATNIVRSGIIKPTLIYDESKLRSRRILVNWLSPNFWTPGFRYGNVRFQYDWKQLITAKNYYWVEVMDYVVQACRILVTEKNYDHDTELQRYQPCTGDGPWWWDQTSDVHYWNGNVCLEVMVEDELRVSDATKVSFVKHHDQYCAIDPTACRDKGLLEGHAGAEFVAGLINADFDARSLKMAVIEGSARKPSTALDQALNHLVFRFHNLTFSGSVRAGTSESRALTRAAFGAFHRRDRDELKALVMLFATRQDMLASVQDLLLEALGLDSLEL